jgi:hypothetical protein
VFAALLVAFPAFAAGPPRPVAPAPPLFQPDFETDPVRMALAVVGASSAPLHGYSGGAALFAGEHPRVRAWRLEGVMTNRVTRRACGTAAAVLGGFTPGPAGSAALAELATLRVGGYLECWLLRDTDRFYTLPRELLAVITDGRGISIGGAEAWAYGKVLTRANYTSAAAFKKAARKDVTYTHYFEEPDVYRGTVVHIEGKLRRINRYNPPPEAADAGVNDLYEAWIFSEFLGTSPYCAVFTEWPAGLPRDLLGKGKINDTYVVRMDGYFYKKFGYQSNDGGQTHRQAPLVIGHALLYDAGPAESSPSGGGWVGAIATGILAVFGAFVCAVVAVTWWFRRGDNTIRRRLRDACGPEFVLPPPDAMPVATAVAPPVKRPNGSDRTTLPSRITFIGGSGDRGDGGGNRGPTEKPPDEGAGARPGP